jgi:hypothetical protein
MSKLEYHRPLFLDESASFHGLFGATRRIKDTRTSNLTRNHANLRIQSLQPRFRAGAVTTGANLGPRSNGKPVFRAASCCPD